MSQVSESTKLQLAHELSNNQLVKFGSFTLKSGILSPIYIDFRQAQSYPSTLRTVAKAFGEMLTGVETSIFLAGVPEAGTPLATATGYEYGFKLLQPRKVVKEHGTKSSIEGAFSDGDSVILIDDLITKGDSKLEAIEQVEAAGLKVEKFLVLVDREQGGMDTIRDAGYEIQAAMTISELLEILRSDGTLPHEKYDEVMKFILHN
jgi:uridine monophosphate synthetase